MKEEVSSFFAAVWAYMEEQVVNERTRIKSNDIIN